MQSSGQSSTSGELVSGLELVAVVAGSGVRELASAGEDSMDAMGERRGCFSLVEGSITSL